LVFSKLAENVLSAQIKAIPEFEIVSAKTSLLRRLTVKTTTPDRQYFIHEETNNKFLIY